MANKIYPPSTLSDICKELNITVGSDKNLRADVKYLIATINVPEHKEKLLALGFDTENPPLRKKVTYSAMEYIYETVFHCK